MAETLVNEPDAARYALYVDGQLISIADYRINGHSISFPHTYTQPSHRGKGFAERIVDFAMDDVELNSDRKVVPMCWYVAQWFDKHPDRSGLLSR